MSRLKIALLLISLLVWIVPAHASAAKTNLVFNTEGTLNRSSHDYGPYLSEVQNPQPKSKTQRIPRSTKRVRTVSYGYCSCVTYVKAKIGYTKSVGAARNWPINSQTPIPGAVIVTMESRIGHVAIVDHADEQFIYLQSEANYSHCKVTYGRKIPIKSKLIKGFYI